MRGGKSYHLNSTCDIGELDSPGPDRGKRGAMRREPLTGNTGEDLEPHKPVHETPTVSCTGKTGHEGSPFEFVADESRMSVIYTTASEALPCRTGSGKSAHPGLRGMRRGNPL